MAIIPGAKAGFELQMSQNIATNAKAQGNISEWILEKYGKDETEKMIYQ